MQSDPPPCVSWTWSNYPCCREHDPCTWSRWPCLGHGVDSWKTWSQLINQRINGSEDDKVLIRKFYIISLSFLVYGLLDFWANNCLHLQIILEQSLFFVPWNPKMTLRLLTNFKVCTRRGRSSKANFKEILLVLHLETEQKVMIKSLMNQSFNEDNVHVVEVLSSIY